MKLLIAVAPDRFRDEELSEPLKVFNAEGIEVVIGSTQTGECLGMLGDRVEATVTFADADPDEYDGIVIIGGIGSQDFLWTSAELVGVVKDLFERGKVVSAICLSPAILGIAGVLNGRRATFFVSPASNRVMDEAGVIISKDPVVTDGTIVTANGPGAAKAFGEAVVAALKQ
ncbi:hypothetical protein RJ53_03115 [Methanocalculus chunghsingensis]|uniref:DJ-1/PfpI domain-containing protein n=1 Tax=Methanocalculus chunghsingensis TaxID=156457 RepID=A0A8J8B6D8_9EURY|nr:DJ-1/PfpI family protein [Methanocalculus chunghsingensis]MBR1368547.1 hypothetical protein [Methanocalculus chunghsingensis]